MSFWTDRMKSPSGQQGIPLPASCCSLPFISREGTLAEKTTPSAYRCGGKASARRVEDMHALSTELIVLQSISEAAILRTVLHL